MSRAVTLVDDTRNVIKIYDGDYDDSFVTSATFLLSGEGDDNANAYISFKDFGAHDHLMELDGGTVVVEGLSFDGGKSEAVRVQGGATLALVNVEILDSPIGSIDVAASTVTLYNVEIHDGMGGEPAINLSNSQLTMLRTVMYTLTGGCVRASNSKYDIENSFLVTCGGPALQQLGPTPSRAVFTFNTVVNNTTGVTCASPIVVSSSIFAYNGTAPQVPTLRDDDVLVVLRFRRPRHRQHRGRSVVRRGRRRSHQLRITGTGQGRPGVDADGRLRRRARPHGQGFDIGADEHY